MQLHAQSAEQFITWGDRALALNDAYGASRYYGEALKTQPGIMETQWKYAEACRLSNQYGEAALFYDKVAGKDRAGKHREAWHWLAEMQMSNGHYDEAEKTWAKVKQKERHKNSMVAQRADNGLGRLPLGENDDGRPGQRCEDRTLADAGEQFRQRVWWAHRAGQRVVLHIAAR
jgi:tetratricopeptide (TPR) repeat protein